MGIIEQAKELVKLTQDLQDAELYRKIVTLQGEIFELHDTNQTLRERVRELEDQLALRERLVFEQNFYWIKDGDKLEGPYCPRCYDKEQALRRMLSLLDDRCLGCPTCTLIRGKDGSDPSGAAVEVGQRHLVQIKPK